MEALITAVDIVNTSMKYLIVLVYILGGVALLYGLDDTPRETRVKRPLFFLVGTSPLLFVVLYPYSEGIAGLFEIKTVLWLIVVPWIALFYVFVVSRDEKHKSRLE